MINGDKMEERPSKELLKAISRKFPNLEFTDEQDELPLQLVDAICSVDKYAFLDIYNRFVTGIESEDAKVSPILEDTAKGLTYDYVYITELYIKVNGKHITLYYYLTRKSTRNMKKWK